MFAAPPLCSFLQVCKNLRSNPSATLTRNFLWLPWQQNRCFIGARRCVPRSTSQNAFVMVIMPKTLASVAGNSFKKGNAENAPERAFPAQEPRQRVLLVARPRQCVACQCVRVKLGARYGFALYFAFRCHAGRQALRTQSPFRLSFLKSKISLLHPSRIIGFKNVPPLYIPP